MPKLNSSILPIELEGKKSPQGLNNTPESFINIRFTNKKNLNLFASRKIELEFNKRALNLLEASRNSIVGFLIEGEVVIPAGQVTADSTIIKADNINLTSDRV